MAYPRYQTGGYQHGAPPRVGVAPRRPGVVLAGVIITYIGGGMLLLVGLMVLLGTIKGRFGIENVSMPADAVTPVGALCAVVGVLLVVLAVLTQRGHGAARTGLTAIGALFIVGQLYEVTTGNLVPLAGVAWIAVAVLLLWVGRATTWFRAARHH